MSGCRTLRGRCLAYGEGATFWPLREIVIAAAGVADGDPPEAIQARLAALVAGEPDAERIARHMGEAIWDIAGRGQPR